MLSLNGVSAWVEVDGKELEQYAVEEDLQQSQVVCWIATQTDKSFSVVFKDNSTNRDHSLGSFLDLDGLSVGGRVLRPLTTTMDHPNFLARRTVIQKDQVLSATSSRPFMFANLELTDEDEYLNRASTHLGEIRIRIYKGQALSSYPQPAVPGTEGYNKVHERSKKAVTHCVSYGPEAKTATTVYACNFKHLDGNPLVTFVFRYRKFGLLQANGIIPDLPPVKNEVITSEEVLDLTVDDDVKAKPVNEQIKVVDNATQKKAALLSKRLNSNSENEARPVKKVKREKKFVPTEEVIDLT